MHWLHGIHTHVREDSSMETAPAAWAQVLILDATGSWSVWPVFPTLGCLHSLEIIKVCAAQMFKLLMPPFECLYRIVASVKIMLCVCVCVCECERKRARAQSCPTLYDPMDCSPPESSVYGIFQARIPEWVAISFSRGSSQPRDRTRVFHIAGRRFNL